MRLVVHWFICTHMCIHIIPWIIKFKLHLYKAFLIFLSILKPLIGTNQWFNDCSNEIRLCCSGAVDKLCERYGWKVQAIKHAWFLTLHHCTIWTLINTRFSLLANIPRLVICKTVEVTIPEIEVMRLAHYLTIGSECSTSLSSYLQKLYVDFLLSLHFFCCLFKCNSKVRTLNIRTYQTEIVQSKDGMRGWPLVSMVLSAAQSILRPRKSGSTLRY